MTSPETNEKKIETLTKIARLLSDQVKEQNNKISLLQREVATLKASFAQSAQPSLGSEVESIPPDQQLTSHTQSTTVIKPSETPEAHSSRSTVVTADFSEEKDSEKQELLAALKIIDNL
jgi:uncharacterized small protein (DUF1192 family)